MNLKLTVWICDMSMTLYDPLMRTCIRVSFRYIPCVLMYIVSLCTYLDAPLLLCHRACLLSTEHDLGRELYTCVCTSHASHRLQLYITTAPGVQAR